MSFRIRKGTHVSHFHDKCAQWPAEHFYELDQPLWWGKLCDECTRLAVAELEARRAKLNPAAS